MEFFTSGTADQFDLVRNLHYGLTAYSGLIAVGCLLYFGYAYSSKKADQKKAATLKQGMYYSILGIFLAVTSFLLMSIIFKSFDGVADTTDLFDLLMDLHYGMTAYAGVICGLFLLYSGYRYVTAGSDAGQKARARNGVFYSFIALSIAIISYLVMNIIFGLFGAASNGSDTGPNIQTGGGGSASGGALVDLGDELTTGGGGSASGGRPSEPVSIPVTEELIIDSSL